MEARVISRTRPTLTHSRAHTRTRARLHVVQVQNVTDVDDKIIAKAAQQGADAADVARHWEDEFNKDMARLHVRAPTAIVRVSGYVAEIVAFIEGIVARGHAYDTPEGVYFDTGAFAREHTYGKLQPKRQAAAAAASGAASSMESSVKKRPADFALWKPAKEGEPRWASPWGEGRPGWHIECSAMASAVFGPTLDLHTGGQDLAFPHHENELAQSESYHCTQQWCNYFLHSGHVMLKDTKISKSLGNTIGVDELFKSCSPSQFRLLCLGTRYHHSFNFSDDLVERAKASEARVHELFQTCLAADQAAKAGAAEGAGAGAGWAEAATAKWTAADQEMLGRVGRAKDGCDAAFRNDFDTPAALALLLDLVNDCNKHLSR